MEEVRLRAEMRLGGQGRTTARTDTNIMFACVVVAEEGRTMFDPSEIVYAPVGVIDTKVKIDPTAWTRAVKCPPPDQNAVFLLYPLLTRRQSGLPPR